MLLDMVTPFLGGGGGGLVWGGLLDSMVLPPPFSPVSRCPLSISSPLSPPLCPFFVFSCSLQHLSQHFTIQNPVLPTHSHMHTRTLTHTRFYRSLPSFPTLSLPTPFPGTRPSQEDEKAECGGEEEEA